MDEDEQMLQFVLQQSKEEHDRKVAAEASTSTTDASDATTTAYQGVGSTGFTQGGVVSASSGVIDLCNDGDSDGDGAGALSQEEDDLAIALQMSMADN